MVNVVSEVSDVFGGTKKRKRIRRLSPNSLHNVTPTDVTVTLHQVAHFLYKMFGDTSQFVLVFNILPINLVQTLKFRFCINLPQILRGINCIF